MATYGSRKSTETKEIKGRTRKSAQERAFWLTALAALAGGAYLLISCPGIFVQNVLGYGEYWGITYRLRQKGWEPWRSIRFGDYTFAQTAVILPLKMIVLGTSLLIAWRRRETGGPWSL